MAKGSLVLFFTLVFFSLRGQQLPMYTQFPFNAYSLNPSFVASTGRSEVNISCRQMWSGFRDRPSTFQGDFQLPVNRHIRLGFTMYNDRSVLLSQGQMMATFGYQVNLSSDKIISFGLSGGFLSSHIRLEDLENNINIDPVLSSAQYNRLNFDAAFGVHFKHRGWTISYSILHLVNSAFVGLVEVPSSSMIYRDQWFYASYQKEWTPELSFTPYVGYRFNMSIQNFYEVGGVVGFSQRLHLGAGYRQGMGPHLTARVRWNQLEIGYSYDFPSRNQQVSTAGANEIQMKYTFGKWVDGSKKALIRGKSRYDAESNIKYYEEHLAKSKKRKSWNSLSKRKNGLTKKQKQRTPKTPSKLYEKQDSKPNRLPSFIPENE